VLAHDYSRAASSLFFLGSLQLLLFEPHAAEVFGTPKLGGRENYVEERSGNLKGESPPGPQGTEKPHNGNSLDDGACKCRNASKAEDFAEEVVIVRVYAI
jgi:hypothetical protein